MRKHPIIIPFAQRKPTDIVVIDGEEEELYLESPCFPCRNYLREHTCKAFPDGIPREILDGANDHHQPYPGDHGIQFEPLWT